MISSEDKDAEMSHLEKEMADIQLAIKQLFEKLERIAQRERFKLHRVRAEKHHQEKQQQTIRRLVELESKNEQLKRENSTLKRENIARTDVNNKLKHSLDQEAEKYRRQMQMINEQPSTEQQLRSANVQAISETADNSTVSELRKQLNVTTERLNETIEQRNEMQQRLSDVQKRLTLAEQVTAATQQRALQESDISEELRRELTQHHQPTTRTGFILISVNCVNYIIT